MKQPACPGCNSASSLTQLGLAPAPGRRSFDEILDERVLKKKSYYDDNSLIIIIMAFIPELPSSLVRERQNCVAKKKSATEASLLTR